MKNLLITGASGLIGRALVKHCATRFNVTGTYMTRNFDPDAIQLKQLDLSKPDEIESCIDATRPSVVIHAAGLTDLQYCQSKQKKTEEINYRATAQLAAFCAQRGIKLVYLSTDMVFDGEKGGYKEDDAAEPKSVYGKSKILAEKAIQEICENYVIARINLIYGHGESKKKTFTDRILIANWSGKPYPVYKSQTRSPISLDVASRAVRELAEGEFKGIFHLGGDETVDRWELALKLLSLLKVDHSVIEEGEIPDEYKDIYPMNTSFDTTKVKNELKTEMLSVEEGLKLEYGRYLE